MMKLLTLTLLSAALVVSGASPLLQKIAPNVWVYGTDFTFFNRSIGNNGMLVHTRQGLVAIGAPELSDQLKTELRDLTKTLNTRITHVVCTDFHHLYSADWGTNFTTATVYYTGIRGWRFHQDVNFKKAILNVNAPVLPRVFNEITLIPIRGFRGPGAPYFSRLPDEVPRTEVAVLVYPKVQLLYLFDFVLCSPVDPNIPKYRPNFGPNPPAGFQTNVTSLAQDTIKTFSRLPPLEHMVFGHGPLDQHCHVTGAANIRDVIQKYIVNVPLV